MTYRMHNIAALILLASTISLLATAACPELCRTAIADSPKTPRPPDKVYVPYEKLKGVLHGEQQGVFLPYKDFRRLWEAAQGTPAGVTEAPSDYLISTARYTGTVGPKLASLTLELTVDVLVDGWVSVPLGLGAGQVAVADVSFVGKDKVQPLLRVTDPQGKGPGRRRYVLLTRGKGRKVLKIDFVRQLQTRPGLNVLDYAMPPAAISTLELLIPDQNMKVDVKPMLAATTSQVTVAGKKATKLQAFLGSANAVELSWKPTTQAAAELAPVIISSQLQHIHVSEALISHEVVFTYDIRRRGVDALTIQLPGGFRVTSVDGANISKWDITPLKTPEGPAGQLLKVALFTPAKDTYTLTVKMERFLKESAAAIALEPVITQQVLRRTGLVAITRSPRRSVELRKIKGLARVDTGRLPALLRGRTGAMAYRFITADYGAQMAVDTVEPRITAAHYWALCVDDTLQLHGRLNYTIERAGIFRIKINLPEPWELVSVGPATLVDDHQLSGSGRDRQINILLTREVMGPAYLDIVARAPRAKADDPAVFHLPLPDEKDLHLYTGQLMLLLAQRLRAEVDTVDQLQPISWNQASRWKSFGNLAPAMAFQFRGIDRKKPAGATFKIAVKPSQVSAVVHRLVNIQPGAVEDSAVIEYRVLYAPVDTFYVQVPAALDKAGIDIIGANIKEKPRIDKLPDDPAADAAANPDRAYYKVVLQSPVIGTYHLTVRSRRRFDQARPVVVGPILAAGKLSDQSGHIAVAKADTLAITAPTMKNLVPGDPGSAADLPWAAHRKVAALAFKYTRPPFELSLPVVRQVEAAVITTMATAAVVEQVLDNEGRLNSRVVYLLKTSKGDRLRITLPKTARLTGIQLNGAEAPVEGTDKPNEVVVRMAPTAGQVTQVVLDIRYFMEDASAGELAVPTLPQDVAYQLTLWRLWVPRDDYVLGHDRVFTPLDQYQAEELLQRLAVGQPAPVEFALAGQGRLLNFQRQGAPGELSVSLMGRRAFAITLWIILLAAGAAMLRLCGLHRCLIVLAGVMVLAVIYLFSEPLVLRFVQTGFLAMVVVAVGWLAHWFFGWLKNRPRKQRAAPPPVPAAAEPRPDTDPPQEG